MFEINSDYGRSQFALKCAAVVVVLSIAAVGAIFF